MIIASLKQGSREIAAILSKGKFYPLPGINAESKEVWPETLFSLIESGRLEELKGWSAEYLSTPPVSMDKIAIPENEADFAPLYRNPHKIWGIGLNYRDHAADLSEKSPTAEPASFMKPDTAIIGHGDTIEIPKMSTKTTGEAELGLIFGKKCRDVSKEDWLSPLAGFTTVIDMTAEDILRRNPRNLTQSKSFDTFFSFGPFFYTTDEISNVFETRVKTVINGRVHAENVVSNMTFPPDFLVSYHSHIMTMLPGDIISSGTPGAAPLKDGDIVECHIEGFRPLINRVRDLKI